jgi:ABC-type dipeptide/oligopeptide/nickel transport system permease subunit
VALLALLAVLAPAIAPWDPNRPDVKKILDAPSGVHPLGTDQLGRDVLSRMLYGARVSLAVGFVSVGIASLIGTMLGAVAGYHGGVVAPVLVAMTLGIPAAILTESGLSFLGLGVQPPHATWGNILNEGKDAIEIGWWLSVYPGLAILVTVLSYNLLGEGIRDALDPRLRQSVGRIVTRR